MHSIPSATIHDLIDRYDALLFDAYGVLVHGDGPLPGACELLAKLRAAGKPFFLVTNSAARLPEDAARRYQGFGLAIESDQIISAGGLLRPYFAANGLQGFRCAILGPEGTFHLVAQAGGLAVTPEEDFDVLVIGDQVGFPFLEFMDTVLSRLIDKFDRGDNPTLILPNPDLIYPRSGGFGLTCGSMALVIETVLKQRYPSRTDIGFTHLGKPETALFEEAAQRAGTRNLLMIGDQMDTDIRGAVRFGIDSALVAGGVAELEFHDAGTHWWPTYRLASL